MKKGLILATAAFLLIPAFAITGVKAISEKEETVIISENSSDITGDGVNEKISLNGEPYEEEEQFLKEIYIDVTTSNEKRFTIPLESGEKASFQLIDFNQDGVKDIFANVVTGGTDGDIYSYLYTLKDFIRKDLSVPDPLEMDSSFEKGYKAKLTITATDKTYLFDLKDRKKYYKKLGIYYKGKLNEPTELTVNTFHSLRPANIGGGVIGLKGIQRVTGAANTDTIAIVESSWKYEDGKWKLIKAEVQNEVNN
ncbi:hypothetical protein [Neobacillus sp. FSL H8-0543]|uniref:hypothetical protein n=1 Tax=Neobacillus sp. FSL H8-0543 TaxID=2954672 RepID=UPI0031595564